MKILSFLVILISISTACNNEKRQLAQNPSPMEEYIRPHERVDGSKCVGTRLKLENIFVDPIDVFIPDHLVEGDTTDLIIHFHGTSSVTEWATCSNDKKLVVVTINLGSGSSKYEQPFLDHEMFSKMLKEIQSVLKDHKLILHHTFLSGFSAGYGAIRAILNHPTNLPIVDGILLLDGLHTDYQPEGLRLYEGGKINGDTLQSFLTFAQLAANEKKHFVFTHSSIFPGTYASTTECADYLISKLGLSRKSVLKPGPLGMQQVGMTEKGNLKIMAFAGNTAPDHIDHFHGFYAFIELLLLDD